MKIEMNDNVVLVAFLVVAAIAVGGFFLAVAFSGWPVGF